MAIHLTALTPAQVDEVIQLAENRASTFSQR